MIKPRPPAATFFRVIVALTAWFALALQFAVMFRARDINGLTTAGIVWRLLLFFTILCNLLVAVSLTTRILTPGSPIAASFAKPGTEAAIALYILVVGLVYNTILRNLLQLQGWNRVADELLHVVVPILFILYWLFFVPKGTLRIRNIWPWLVFPAGYLAYALLRGNAEDFYAYPFINVKELGYPRVLFNSLGVLVVFVLAALLLIWLDRLLGRKRDRPVAV